VHTLHTPTLPLAMQAGAIIDPASNALSFPRVALICPTADPSAASVCWTRAEGTVRRNFFGTYPFNSVVNLIKKIVTTDSDDVIAMGFPALQPLQQAGITLLARVSQCSV
jgi:hypothetical protein